MTQNSHRNSEYQLEDAPLTPIGSTLIQDVFKAAAILGLAIAAVTFFATRGEHPERLSRLSYKPPSTPTAKVSVADEPMMQVETVLAEPVTESVVESTVTAVAVIDAAEPVQKAEPAVISTEVAVMTPVEDESNTDLSLVTETESSQNHVNNLPVDHAPTALPLWNVQRVGMSQMQVYRAPIIMPAIVLPQREARTPRMPRSLVAESSSE